MKYINIFFSFVNSDFNSEIISDWIKWINNDSDNIYNIYILLNERTDDTILIEIMKVLKKHKFLYFKTDTIKKGLDHFYTLLLNYYEINNIIMTDIFLLWIPEGWSIMKNNQISLNNLLTYTTKYSYFNFSYHRFNSIWSFDPHLISYKLWKELHYNDFHATPHDNLELISKNNISKKFKNINLLHNLTIINSIKDDTFFTQKYLLEENSFYTYHDEKYNILENNKFIKKESIIGKLNNKYLFIRISPGFVKKEPFTLTTDKSSQINLKVPVKSSNETVSKINLKVPVKSSNETIPKIILKNTVKETNENITKISIKSINKDMQNIQFKKDKCNVLYLIDKNSYITKMSRVRFHAIKKLGEIANVIYWGQNWNNYDDNLTLDENITRNLNFHIDYIIAYKPQSIKNFKNCKIPKTISFNEMWDEKITLTEINAVQPDLIVCHHDNDRVRYQTVLKKNIECYTKLVHIGHCAENSIFYDKKEDRPIDILLCGTVGRHYPLRQRLQKIIKIMPKKYNCMEYKHPGYINGDSFTNIYLKDFADGINKAKICITCTSKYFYRLGKMVEIPMAGSVLACDLPDQDQEVFKQIMIVINPSDTDEQIINQLVHYLENPNKLEEIRLRGLEWSKKYVQNTYANSILENMKVLNKSPKIFVLADELKDLKSKWICDVLKEEFIKYSNLNIVTNSSDADIIWLMAPWATRKINMKHLQDKFVITTVHHVDWEKYEESKDYYKMIDSITNRYHTICPKTCESFKKLTTKKIDVANFWINENNFFK